MTPDLSTSLRASLTDGLHAIHEANRRQRLLAEAEAAAEYGDASPGELAELALLVAKAVANGELSEDAGRWLARRIRLRPDADVLFDALCDAVRQHSAFTADPSGYSALRDWPTDARSLDERYVRFEAAVEAAVAAMVTT